MTLPNIFYNVTKDLK